MKKEVKVISLGGSLIAPERIDKKFIIGFKKIILKNSATNKFIIVCGGGHPARIAIAELKAKGKSQKEQALAGMNATRENAKELIKAFEEKSNAELPNSTEEIKKTITKKDIIICGALRYSKNETSDGTAAKIAAQFNTSLINMTNVKGLYTTNPKENKNAKFIEKISWKDFEKKALKIKYAPGQHFVLDQGAAMLIRKNKTPTYIISQKLTNLNNLLKNKKFVGTTIAN